MPVTFQVASHPSEEYLTRGKTRVANRDELFSQTCAEEARGSKRVIHSSPSLSNECLAEHHVFPSNNGFVKSAWDAYSHHSHLIIRPDDIWFAILSQLNFYINKNAEELRDHFVSHDGQKELVIADVGSIETMDFGLFARRMTGLLQENLKDPNFRDWIMPTFSTTTVDDRSTAAVLMMGSLQAYFTYRSLLMCGIPSVTLLGERADYKDILQRLDKLDELGPETADWANLLRPVLRNFIASFDKVMMTETKDFWNRIAHHQRGSGTSRLSGWLTAFCFWRNDGVCLYPARNQKPDKRAYANGKGSNICTPKFELDGIVYHTINTSAIPSGFASVPVLVDDNRVRHRTKMVAGSLGIKAERSGDVDEEGIKKLDSLSNLTGWIMYEVK
jgi:hypothetical protein